VRKGIDFFNTIVQLVIFFAVFQQVYLLTANFAAAKIYFFTKKMAILAPNFN
jgi:hypothetical protein